MKRSLILFLIVTLGYSASAQIQTVFGSSHSTGGYGALTNKFTHINGEFANLCGVYGGVYLNHKFFIGIGASAITNDIPVSEEFSAIPGTRLSYEYGQVGMVNEYVIGSNKAFHLAFDLFTGAGFTLQYNRNDWDEYDHSYHDTYTHDENWFFVIEPGVQLEVNLTKWMRFAPGISYRFVEGSNAAGLTDSDLRDINYNVTLKFGKF